MSSAHLGDGGRRFNCGSGSLDDRHEIDGLEAGPADQSAIDVGNGENLGRVGLFYRAPP